MIFSTGRDRLLKASVLHMAEAARLRVKGDKDSMNAAEHETKCADRIMKMYVNKYLSNIKGKL